MIRRHDAARQFEALRGEVLAACGRVLASGRYVLGEEVEAFELEFARYLGVPHVVGVASGTDALTLSLRALGVGPGDEVVTTPYTAIPTVSAILAAGARPVFADIEADTYLVDPEAVTRAVGRRTRAVVVVHLFGNVVDVPALRSALGGRVPVVEDACQAHGSRLRGRRAGSLGDLAAFSFYPTKNLGGYGDGGAIAVGDPGLAAELRRLRQYGMVDKDRTVQPGVNSRLDELQAAMLRVKLPRLDGWNEVRSVLVDRYRARFSGGPLRWQRIPEGVETNWHVLAARVPGDQGDRDDLARHLEARGIQTNVYYAVPQHLQEACRGLGHAPGAFPRAEALSREAIALPLYPELPEEELEAVLSAVECWEPRGVVLR
ncbi:MAG: DegT/DnrJ/EryC1/StrS family aminotransferase [Planctomycetes bacterium]|nr:DegT/DnrJ/EryC1/StrS family aminotransferase [Planctomycetota bacterium]